MKQQSKLGVKDRYQLKGLKDLWKGRPDGVAGRFCTKLEFWLNVEDGLSLVGEEEENQGCAGPSLSCLIRSLCCTFQE